MEFMAVSTEKMLMNGFTDELILISKNIYYNESLLLLLHYTVGSYNSGSNVIGKFTIYIRNIQNL